MARQLIKRDKDKVRVNKNRARDIADARSKAIELMSVELHDLYHDMCNKAESLATKTLMYYHWLGEMVHEVGRDGQVPAEIGGTVDKIKKKNGEGSGRVVVIGGVDHHIEPCMRLCVSVGDKVAAGETLTTGTKYGTGSMKLLEAAWITSPSLLYKAAKFADLYTEEEAQDLCELRSDSGYQIGWAHIWQLIHVPDDARPEFESAIIEEDLTVKQLQAMIKDTYTARRIQKSPMLVRPKSLMGTLTQLGAANAKWLERHTTVWSTETFSLFEELEDLSPEEITPGMAEDLEKVVKDQAEMAECCADNVTAAERALAQINRILQQREQEATTADK